MLDISRLGGVIVPLVTPLHADESLDEAALRRLVQHVLRGGVHGVLVMGTASEFAALAEGDRRRAVEIAVEEVKGGIPVLAGIGDASTRRALQRAEEAQQAGADALVAMLPHCRARLTSREVDAHFEALATTVSLPMLVCNAPQLVGASLTFEAVVRLRELPAVGGIQDASGDFEFFLGLARMGSAAFRVFQGSEAQTAASLLMGAHGCMPPMGNLAPGLWVALYEAAREGNLERLRDLHRLAWELGHICRFEGVSLIGAVKAALEMIGLCQPYPARPLNQPDTHARARIEAEVKRFREYI